MDAFPWTSFTWLSRDLVLAKRCNCTRDFLQTIASVLQEQSLADGTELGAVAPLVSAEKCLATTSRRFHAQVDCFPAGHSLHSRLPLHCFRCSFDGRLIHHSQSVVPGKATFSSFSCFLTGREKMTSSDLMQSLLLDSPTLLQSPASGCLLEQESG